MSLKERVYSLLLVSAAPKFSAAVTALCAPSIFNPLVTVTSVSAAKRAFSERAFDFVFINSPLPDSDGVRFAIDITMESRSAVVLLFTPSEIYEEIYDRLAPQGVAVLSKPTSRPVFLAALDFMLVQRERLRGLEKRTLTVEEKMEEIRVVNRAKWLLIRELKMDEPAAHRYIEKQAMDLCLTKRQVAEEIIKTYSQL